MDRFVLRNALLSWWHDAWGSRTRVDQQIQSDSGSFRFYTGRITRRRCKSLVAAVRRSIFSRFICLSLSFSLFLSLSLSHRRISPPCRGKLKKKKNGWGGGGGRGENERGTKVVSSTSAFIDSRTSPQTFFFRRAELDSRNFELN